MMVTMKLSILAIAQLLLKGPENVDSFQHHLPCSSFNCRTRKIKSFSVIYADAQHPPSHLSGAVPGQNIGNSSNNNGADFLNSIGGDLSIESTTDHKDTIRRNKKIEKNKRKVTAAVTALLGACTALIAFSGEGAWRYYLAGGICAAISHAVTTPVDVIKVRKVSLFLFFIKWPSAFLHCTKLFNLFNIYDPIDTETGR